MTSVFKKKLLIISFFALVACSQSPALVINNIKKTDNSKFGEVAKNPFLATVSQGDTIYSIAQKYGVGTRNLIEINKLTPPYMLSAGQLLKMPQAMFHVVAAGDTVYAISRSYGVDIGRLVHANNIDKPYIIKTGMKLRIPSSTYAESEDEQDSFANNEIDDTTEAESESESESESVNNDSEVRVNDIADIKETTENTENTEKILPNEIKSEQDFEQNLISIEPKPEDYKSEDYDDESSASDVFKNEYSNPTLKSGSTYEIEAQNKKAENSGFDIAASDNSAFLWPTKGKIISRFGPKEGGLYNDGINIVANEGDEITAAKSGVVVYSGNELRGYGNLVLLKHDNGYVTSYAHAKDIIVKKGEYVKQGQKIALVGNTGHVKTPQVHFSIRKGRKAIDPQKYLPTG